MKRDRFSDIRLADIETFLAVCRYRSVSAAARELRVTPSQVSKAIDRLGRELGRRLLTRTGRGITLTQDGQRLGPHLEDVLIRLRLMRQGDVGPLRELTVAAPSYLISAFLPHIALAQPDVRLRCIQLAPSQVRAFATERFFDVTLSIGLERLPEAWVSRSVGSMRKALFASPLLARKLRPFPVSVDRLRDVPFIAPVYLTNGQLGPADDDCPLRRQDRRVGHEVDTIGLALELAARTGQLAFGPAIASRSLVERGLLEEVPVSGWNVADAVYVACHGDRVRAAAQKAIVHALRAALSEAPQPVRS